MDLGTKPRRSLYNFKRQAIQINYPDTLQSCSKYQTFCRCFLLRRAVLLQEANNEWQPIAYSSRTMTEMERRYTQIEKEALSLTWAAEKFSMYLLGRSFHMETDHKPLVPLLSTKSLNTLPPRVLRFRLHLMRYDFTIAYTPGKHLCIPDTLSRAPIPSSDDSVDLQESVEAFILSVVSTLPATPDRLASLQAAQTQDENLLQVMHYCKVGWSEKNLKGQVKKFWMTRNELPFMMICYSVETELLF